jgi:hypothetical protein
VTTFSDSMTLGEARDGLRELVDAGHECPCCRQFAKVYRRKIHATMARDFLRVWRAVGEGTWFHLPDFVANSGDVPKTRFWGLLDEEIELRRADGGRAGYWRITDLGRAWVLNQATLPKYARIYSGRCLGLVGEPTSIVDSLGDRFDYRELMDS